VLPSIIFEMESRFICFRCNKVFSKSNVLISHIKIMHSLLQKFLCKQDNCIRSFSSISDLRKHLDKNHSELSVTQPNLEAVFENHALASTSRCSNCLPRTQKNKDESTVDPLDAHLWANFKSSYNRDKLRFPWQRCK
jgi:hypothetical protein